MAQVPRPMRDVLRLDAPISMYSMRHLPVLTSTSMRPFVVETHAATTRGGRSDLPPAGLARIHKRQFDRRDSEQRDDGRLLSVALHAVVVRRMGNAPHEA